MKLAAVVVALLGFGARAHAQAPGLTEPIRPLDQPATPRADPPVDGGTVTTQILLGGVMGAGGAVLGALAGVGIACGSHDCESDGDVIPALIIAYTGGSLGIAAGEYVAGNHGRAEGSFGWTFGGAMVGGFVGIAGAAMIDNSLDYTHRDARDTLEAVSIIGGWLGGGLVGYYETRHWKTTALHAVMPTMQASGRGVSFGVGAQF
jgi:hypothetical protein